MTDDLMYNGGQPINPASGARLVSRSASRVVYSIVDSEGDPIDLRLFKQDRNIPVQVKGARIEQGGYQLNLILEYLHGHNSTQDN